MTLKKISKSSVVLFIAAAHTQRIHAQPYSNLPAVMQAIDAERAKPENALEVQRQELEAEIFAQLLVLDRMAPIANEKPSIFGYSMAQYSKELAISNNVINLQNKLQELAAYPLNKNLKLQPYSDKELKSVQLKKILKSFSSIHSNKEGLSANVMDAIQNTLQEKLPNGAIARLTSNPADFLHKATMSAINPDLKSNEDYGLLLTGVPLAKMSAEQRKAFELRLNQSVLNLRKFDEQLKADGETLTEGEKLEYASQLLEFLSGQSNTAPDYQALMEESDEAANGAHQGSENNDDIDIIGGAAARREDRGTEDSDPQICTGAPNPAGVKYSINIPHDRKIYAYDFTTKDYVELKSNDVFVGKSTGNITLEGAVYDGAYFGHLEANPSHHVVISKGFSAPTRWGPHEKVSLLTRIPPGSRPTQSTKKPVQSTQAPQEQAMANADPVSLVYAARKLQGKGPCEVIKIGLPTPEQGVRCAFQVSRALKLAGYDVKGSNSVVTLVTNLREAGWKRWNKKIKGCEIPPRGSIAATNSSFNPSYYRSHVGIVDGNVIYNNSGSAGGKMMARTKDFDKWVHTKNMLYLVDPATAVNPSLSKCISSSTIYQSL